MSSVGKFRCVDNTYFVMLNVIITPHAQRERGKVIDRGVHIYIYITEKPFTSK